MNKQERQVLEQVRDNITVLLDKAPEVETVDAMTLRRTIADRDAVIADLQAQVAGLLNGQARAL